MKLKNPAIKSAELDFKKIDFKSLVIGLFQGKQELHPLAKRVDNEFGNILSLCIKNKDFLGEKNEVKYLYVAKNKLTNIVLVGLGEESKFSLDALSNSVANAMKKLRDSGSDRIGILAGSFLTKRISDDTVIEKAAISALAGLYRFDDFKTRDKEKLKHVSEIKFIGDRKYDSILENASVIAEAVNKTRDLIIMPPNIATPDYVANYASGISKEHKIKCTVLEESDLKKLGMGCFLAVAQGSSLKPKMVVMEYNGGGKKPPIVLIGKGITFDSGGLNLKPYPYILNMKDDKGGAAAVIHVIEACSILRIPLNLVAIAPLCENMPSGSSYRPDDVIKSHSGITVEVKNTDAEGRMILADALSYSLKYSPQAIIDVATLTGASMITLGYIGTPIIGNDANLVARIKNASAKSLEKVWELPLWEEYDENLKSDIADIKHISEEGDAGVIIGAAFLKNFIGDTPWVHIDIGTTVWSKVDKGMLTKGPTGATVRLLIEALRNWK